MSIAEEHMMSWLRDAHAMEEQAATLLERQAERIENYPALKSRLEQHLTETKRQAERLRACIERHESTTSAVKDIAGKMMATAQAMSGIFVDDEIVKGSLANYTFEQMEIASYRILIAAAEAVGDTETKRACEQNLREEEEMAQWLAENIPAVTRQYLAREEMPSVTAKH